MTPLKLLQGLKKIIQAAVGKYKLSTQYSDDRNVQIYIQNVSENEFNSKSNYPLVLVELLTIEDEPQNSIANVLITVGTYNSTTEHFNLVQEIRQCILQNPIVEQFALRYPLVTGSVEKQAADFDFSNLFAQYNLPVHSQLFE